MTILVESQACACIPRGSRQGGCVLFLFLKAVLILLVAWALGSLRLYFSELK